MLPRLRFVFAAALIAALPWILIGSGIVTTAQNTPIAENDRAGSAVSLAAGDLRDAHHMHALAFVRRSRELERLRELGSAPLAEWVAAPVGVVPQEAPERAEAAPEIAEAEPDAAPAEQTPSASEQGMSVQAAEEANPETAGDLAQMPAGAPTETPSETTARQPPEEPAPKLAQEHPQKHPEELPTVVAGLPSDPLPADSAVAATSPAPPEESDPAKPDAAESAAPGAPSESVHDASRNEHVEADLSHTDWSKLVPPLPRARQSEEARRTATRRARARRAQAEISARNMQAINDPFSVQPAPIGAPTRSAGASPNPFGGPPATPLPPPGRPGGFR